MVRGREGGDGARGVGWGGLFRITPFFFFFVFSVKVLLTSRTVVIPILLPVLKSETDKSELLQSHRSVDSNEVWVEEVPTLFLIFSSITFVTYDGVYVIHELFTNDLDLCMFSVPFVYPY